MSVDAETLRRLRWRCRRGLLELDLVFQRFLDQRYGQLNPKQQQAFRALLELQDNTLLAYLNGEESPAQPELKAIIREMS